MYHKTEDLNPVVEKIGQLHFDGNITPHSWYKSPLLQNEKGKPNLVATTLLADIVYWYRPTLIRDEVSNAEIGRKQKFAADKLQKHYANWGEGFGLTLRQVEDAVAFLKRNGLITVEVRAVTTDRGTMPRCAFIEPVYEAIRAITFPSPEKTGDKPPKNGRSVPKKREMPPAKTGGKARKNGASLPKNGEHTYTTPNITANTSANESENNSADNLPPPSPPPADDAPTAANKGEEEDSIHNNDEAKKRQVRADNMVAKIISVTHDRSDRDVLHGLCLRCVQEEHKAAWKHVLKTMGDKMALANPPQMPNSYAVTVFQKALDNLVPVESPAPVPPAPRPAPQEAPAGPDAAACQEYYDSLDEEARAALDKEAIKETHPDFRKFVKTVRSSRDTIIAERLAEQVGAKDGEQGVEEV